MIIYLSLAKFKLYTNGEKVVGGGNSTSKCLIEMICSNKSIKCLTLIKSVLSLAKK